MLSKRVFLVVLMAIVVLLPATALVAQEQNLQLPAVGSELPIPEWVTEINGIPLDGETRTVEQIEAAGYICGFVNDVTVYKWNAIPEDGVIRFDRFKPGELQFCRNANGKEVKQDCGNALPSYQDMDRLLTPPLQVKSGSARVYIDNSVKVFGGQNIDVNNTMVNGSNFGTITTGDQGVSSNPNLGSSEPRSIQNGSGGDQEGDEGKALVEQFRKAFPHITDRGVGPWSIWSTFLLLLIAILVGIILWRIWTRRNPKRKPSSRPSPPTPSAPVVPPAGTPSDPTPLASPVSSGGDSIPAEVSTGSRRFRLAGTFKGEAEEVVDGNPEPDTPVSGVDDGDTDGGDSPAEPAIVPPEPPAAPASPENPARPRNGR